MSTPIFEDLNAESGTNVTIIESLCVKCFNNGQTKMLLTKIPFYKEVLIVSFSCDHCGYENNEIQSAGEIQPRGIKIILTVTQVSDLNRRVVKSDYSSVKITEVSLEIPEQSQKGEVTTLEGIIARTIRGLEQEQGIRRQKYPEAAKQIDDYIQSLQKLKDVSTPFTFIIEDISGNSHVENPNAPQVDFNCKVQYFHRTTEQDNALGIYLAEQRTEVEQVSDKNKELLKPLAENSWTYEDLQGEVLRFPTICMSCKTSCETNMKVTSIPHFKDVVIMCTNCDACGFKTNEVKSGGGIEEKGVRFEILINHIEDLNRDVLKSETCSLLIPELNCEVGAAALSGRFTTVEGILVAMKDQLIGSGNMFKDSQDKCTRDRILKFTEQIDEIIRLEYSATLILDDPTGNSYIQSLVDEGLDDKLKIIRYIRTDDQNEELGLNDMKTENYN